MSLGERLAQEDATLQPSADWAKGSQLTRDQGLGRRARSVHRPSSGKAWTSTSAGGVAPTPGVRLCLARLRDMASRYDAIVIGLGGMGQRSRLPPGAPRTSVLGLEQYEMLHERGRRMA